MIALIIMVLLIIVASIWYGHYWREEYWRKLSFSRHHSILVKNGSNIIGKKVIEMTDDSIRIQHYGWYSKSDFLGNLTASEGLVFFNV